MINCTNGRNGFIVRTASCPPYKPQEKTLTDITMVQKEHIPTEKPWENFSTRHNISKATICSIVLKCSVGKEGNFVSFRPRNFCPTDQGLKRSDSVKELRRRKPQLKRRSNGVEEKPSKESKLLLVFIQRFFILFNDFLLKSVKSY